MIVLVCGGRKYRHDRMIDFVMTKLMEMGMTILVHGDATGADRLAKEWAEAHGLEHLPFPADWNRYKKRAGSRRNTQMIKEAKPDLVVAFPGGTGTHNMITQSKRHDLAVIIL